MFNKESLSLEEKIKLLSGKSGDDVAEKYGEKYFVMSDGPHGLRVQNNAGDNGVTGSAPATCFPAAAATASFALRTSS